MNDYSGYSAVILGVSVALVQMQAVQAISKTEVSKIAQSITVLIQDAENPKQSGSGVLIKKEGQDYTVLTAQHVVEPSRNFKIITPAGKEYSVSPSLVVQKTQSS